MAGSGSDLTMSGQSNTYILLEPDGAQAIDVFNPPTCERGKDYYIDIFRRIEECSDLQGLTFYLAEVSPESLPSYGNDVVLVLISDEHFHFREYWPDLRCVVRTYTKRPHYQDGAPHTWLKLMSLVHFSYKLAGTGAAFGASTWRRRDLALLNMSSRVMHAPLGCFFRFRPKVRPIAERSIDYAFLGSVEYQASRKTWLHGVLQPPKLASRQRMVEELRSFQETSGYSGMLYTTGDFEESIREQDRYAQALEDCKISICPRGSNPETYRFFESCAAGCVVVCEPLPNAWFYRDSPAIVLRNWKQLPDLLASLLDDPERLQILSTKTQEYWATRVSEAAVAEQLIAYLSQLS